MTNSNEINVFCKRLKEARLAVGLSQKKLGIAIGLDEFVASTRVNRYVFVGKPKSYLLTIFKNEPNRAFTTLELTEKVMKLDNMDGLPQDKHIKAVKSVLYKLQKDGVVVKSKDCNGQIVWQWLN